MPTTLADRLGFDTIAGFERSAPKRLEEGDFLAERYRLTAIYLYGYAAEMILKAAYFKNLRLSPVAEIDRDTRNRAMAVARLLKLTSGDPHDIPGWARLLVRYKEDLGRVAYEPKFSRKIVANAQTIYENWRPEMRYRSMSPTANNVFEVRTAAEWLIKSYPKL